MIKRFFVLITVIIITVQPCYAIEGVDEYITDDMERVLPDNIVDDENVIDIETLIKTFFDSVTDILPNIIKNLLYIISVVILAALFDIFAETVKSEGVKKCFSYLCSACVAIILYNVLVGIWDNLETVMSDINSFMMTLTPATTLLYSIGGNITTAAVNNSAMSIILTVFEAICFHAIMPVLQICFGFSVAAALSGNVNLVPISDFIRKIYTTVIVFVISTMTCVLSLQNMLTRANDSLAARTVKFAASTVIPLVGSSISEAGATLSAGITAIRGTFGVLAIIAIAIIVLPGIITLILNKLAFSLGSAICSVFGLVKVGSLIGSAAQLLNFALAILISVSVMFVISVSLFASAGSAVGV